jgi:hypothetical protein
MRCRMSLVPTRTRSTVAHSGQAGRPQSSQVEKVRPLQWLQGRKKPPREDVGRGCSPYSHHATRSPTRQCAASARAPPRDLTLERRTRPSQLSIVPERFQNEMRGVGRGATAVVGFLVVLLPPMTLPQTVGAGLRGMQREGQGSKSRLGRTETDGQGSRQKTGDAFSKPVPSATRPPLQHLSSKQLNPSLPALGTPHR